VTQKQPVNIRFLTGNQLHWLACIVEAEGSFIAGTPSHPNRTVMHVTTTDLDIAERISSLLGVKISKQKPASQSHKQPYRVVLAGGSAVSLMDLLYQHMGERRRARIDNAKVSHQPRQAWPHLKFQIVIDEIADHNRHWLAGYLEGEGCFGSEKHTKPYATYIRPRVALNSTDEDVILRVQGILYDKFQIRVAVCSFQPKYIGAKISYDLKVRGKKAVLIMKDLYPLMSKRRQAKILEVVANTK
jgi:hypothetical protein